jgi:hypothetical protein
MQKRGWSSLMTVMALVLLEGCATIIAHRPSGEAIEMTPEEYTRYVEQVFRQHSQVTGHLLRAAGNFSEEDIDDANQLTAAARKMIRVCEPFSEGVAERIVSQLSGANINRDLVDSVPACEEAAQQVEGLIP